MLQCNRMLKYNIIQKPRSRIGINFAGSKYSYFTFYTIIIIIIQIYIWEGLTQNHALGLHGFHFKIHSTGKLLLDLVRCELPTMFIQIFLKISWVLERYWGRNMLRQKGNEIQAPHFLLNKKRRQVWFMSSKMNGIHLRYFLFVVYFTRLSVSQTVKRTEYLLNKSNGRYR
jgi:hypothetical protein